jgi:hypothetical protein
MTRIARRCASGANYLNFAVWSIVLVHGITAGTDSGTPWAVALYALAAGSVAGLVVWRASGGGAVAAAEAR